MAFSMEIPTQYGDAGECLQAARKNLDRVRELLLQPTVESVDASAAILREVEVQLGCVGALWKARDAKADPEVRKVLDGIKKDVAILAEFFAQAERLFNGWIGGIQSKRSGYTGQGQAAPLALVNRMSVEG
jgi:hypothetical protein